MTEKEEFYFTHPAIFVAYAHENGDIWSELVGQQIYDRILAGGIINDVEFIEKKPRIHVSFDSYRPNPLSRDDFFNGRILMMTLPAALAQDISEWKGIQANLNVPNTAKAISLIDDFAVKHQPLLLKWQSQVRNVQEKQKASEHFRQLKAKYGIVKLRGSDPTSLLYKILLQIEANEPLPRTEIEWLQTKKYFGLLAQYHEQRLHCTGDEWHRAHACSNWRKANKPENGIALTEHMFIQDQTKKAAVLTTRGGALRDIRNLNEALTCAEQASKCDPKSYYPLNLMGAIYFERGEPEKGDECFARALALGAKPQVQVNEMQGAIRKADTENARRVAAYLLRKDPERYRWAQKYLNKRP